jgi:uncharacterized phage-associated protein
MFAFCSSLENMYDARQVANCILDIGDRSGVSLTHLALQKIVYFAHGLAYARFGGPLILNRVEAWKNGPVVRELYFSFNGFGDRPIKGRAKTLDIRTRLQETITYKFPDDIYRHLEETFRIYGPISASRLVAMTHQRGTPWEQTIMAAAKSANVGMHIDEKLIKEFFAPTTEKHVART